MGRHYIWSVIVLILPVGAYLADTVTSSQHSREACIQALRDQHTSVTTGVYSALGTVTQGVNAIILLSGGSTAWAETILTHVCGLHWGKEDQVNLLGDWLPDVSDSPRNRDNDPWEALTSGPSSISCPRVLLSLS